MKNSVLEFRKNFPGKKMTEKPELEKNAYGDIIEPPFDPSKIPSFDPMQEFADRGQLQQIGTVSYTHLTLPTNREV